MGLWDKLSGELVDIIEWLDETRDTMVWRFPRYQNEIKNGAKLVVRESRVAAFVREGALADTFTQPGTYTLETKNLPILGTLAGWKYGFNSPFKAEVYFVNTRQFTDFKWGTKNPIMLRDADFGMVRVRAFGAFSARVTDAGAFLKELVGTELAYGHFMLVSPTLIKKLDAYRDGLGEAVNLSSGYRSPAHQRATCRSICGKDSCGNVCAARSRHSWGDAADQGIAPSAHLADVACDAKFNFVYREGNHMHLDLNPDHKICTVNIL